MTDNKLHELIEEYGHLRGVDRGTCHDILTNEQENELNNLTDKAKQAILDCVEGDKEEALKPVREVCKENELDIERLCDSSQLIKDITRYGKLNEEQYVMVSALARTTARLMQAIKTALGEK